MIKKIKARDTYGPILDRVKCIVKARETENPNPPPPGGEFNSGNLHSM